MIEAVPSSFAVFWAAVIVFALLVYVVLDGFDLGVGILFGTTRDPKLRGEMMSAIAPYWDGNETWLIVVGATLFAAFPTVYAIFLPAFYLPVLLLLFGLIFRGVAFEFRGRGGPQWLWDGGFTIGSAVIAFVQGAAIGALISGVSVKNGQYSGGSFDWLRPFPVLCGLGLVCGYALLGAGWLILKSNGAARAWAYRRVLWLAAATTAFAVLAGVGALGELKAAGIVYASRPWAILFPVIATLAMICVIAGAWARQNSIPFVMTGVFFVAAFLTLPCLLWPYMIPYAVTVADAAAPEASLSFLFWGAGLFVLPVVAFYTGAVYWFFRAGTTDVKY